MASALDHNALEKIIQRCDAATPGPWISSWEGRDHALGGDSVILRGSERQYEDLYISPCTMVDQDFIAHAREDVPALLKEVVRLRRILTAHGLEVE